MWQFSLPMMQCPHATHKFVSHLVSWDEDVEIGISISIKNNKLRRKNSTRRQHKIKVVNFVSMVHIRSHINFYYLRNFFSEWPPPHLSTWGGDQKTWSYALVSSGWVTNFAQGLRRSTSSPDLVLITNWNKKILM